MAFESLISQLKQGLESIDEYIEQSPKLRQQLRDSYDRQLEELERNVERAYKERDEITEAIEILGNQANSNSEE